MAMATSNGVYKQGRARAPPKESFEEYPLIEAMSTYLSYAVLLVCGHICDFMVKIGLKDSKNRTVKDVSVFVHF